MLSPKIFLTIGCLVIVLLTPISASIDNEFAEFDTDFAQGIESVPQGQSDTPPAASGTSKTNNKSPSPSEPRTHDSDQEQRPQSSKVFDETPNPEAEADNSDSEKKLDLKLVNAPIPRNYKLESYYIEIAFLLASFLYFVNYFLGSSNNRKIAFEWYEQSRELLKQQFSLVGGAPAINDGTTKKDNDDSIDSSATRKQRGLIKTTESLYTLWSSGRVGMDGLLIEMNLLKRQDLFSMALNFIKVSKDKFILRFLLNQDGYENFVFCLAHKNQAAKLARDLIDINTYCPKRKPISQYNISSEKLFVMSELSDVASYVLDQKTATFLEKHESLINYIHITDQYSMVRSEEVSAAQKLANPKRLATFSYNLPQSPAERKELLLFSLNFLDRLRRFKLAKDSKQKSDKNRQKISDILQKTAFSQRQEAAQAKKEQMRRLEKERIYNEDDPEKQRKWEKKEARREQKKNKMRVKQLKVRSM